MSVIDLSVRLLCLVCVILVFLDLGANKHGYTAAWNALPENIRANHDRAVFRKQLKTHFFTLAFNVR